MAEVAAISKNTPVKLQIAAIIGCAGFLIATTVGVTSYCLHMVQGIEGLQTGQAEQKAAIKELTVKFEELRLANDQQNWKRVDQQFYNSSLGTLNPTMKLPDIPPR